MNRQAIITMNGESPAEEPSVEYPHISKTLLLVFCGYVIIWYLQIGYRVPALGAIRFELVYAAALTALAIFATPKIDLKFPLFPYVLLYFLVIVIQIPFSQDFNTSWDVFLDRILKFSFMAFFIVSFVRSPTHLKFFLAAFLLACLKMGQEGLLGRLSGSLVWENQGVMRLHGSTPLYIHPNSFTGMALGTLPFAYFLWPLCSKYIKGILLITGILSLHIILYTGSRTGYVGLMVFLAFIFFKSNYKRKFIVWLVLALVLAIPMIPSDYSERFNTIFTLEEKEGRSAEARMEILKDAWQVFVDNPLGVGVAAFPKVRMDRFGRSQDTHNLYLEVATNLGIQGIVIVGLMFYKMLSMLNKIRTNASKDISLIISNPKYVNDNILHDLSWIEAAASATICFVILRLGLGLFGMDLYEIYWWFAIGITFSLYSMLNRINSALADKFSMMDA
jgi:putative inorganic carbon (hco3(-)) transporter